jgi:cysteine-rich repeat protein
MRLRNVLPVSLAVFLVAVPLLASSSGSGVSPIQKLIRLLISHEQRIDELESCVCCCAGVLEPVCGADRRTWVNACEADCAGVAVIAPGECSPGCVGNEHCAPDHFCGKQAGSCDAPGTCRPRPDACPDVFDPVCGCDGLTYGNACEAAASGVNVAHVGECATGCAANLECGAREFCSKPPGACDAAGVCEARPAACPEIFDPVCGCDGRTYGNACFAASAGVNVQRRGACGATCGNGILDPGEDCDDGNQVDGDGCDADCSYQFCGGIAGVPCPAPYLCFDDPRDDCDPRTGGADCAGICVLD